MLNKSIILKWCQILSYIMLLCSMSSLCVLHILSSSISSIPFIIFKTSIRSPLVLPVLRAVRFSHLNRSAYDQRCQCPACNRGSKLRLRVQCEVLRGINTTSSMISRLSDLVGSLWKSRYITSTGLPSLKYVGFRQSSPSIETEQN